ncbi:arabinogalactan oligomer / maltooligosaccharide transport system permease protein [Paenibacillus sp. UNCCL117]|uniref:carbohydrate ABC transporter permease n=1 Tax=unclassified Paenibacillus TaxID=185978 RepID=UPI0008869C16|nr:MULTISPECIES: sugar ABC transporter permease [unclassified Paenibacillus]SDD05395.1 carbohydrate ABC transporter membrane protein 1, CUT1 family [Paenibacillus sp. cl123]SFW31901.1 arabinogalactan oligomer / maltooligosaccharide transport system permease protein [Paenibacillus sp. UNCCL117]
MGQLRTTVDIAGGKQPPKHGLIAAVLSAMACGLGQLYNRQYIKGVLLLALEAAGLIYLIDNLGRAVWGLITLGETPTKQIKVGEVFQNVPGDHSIFLMINGLITVFAFLLFIAAYIVNVKDAYLIGKQREEGIVPNRFVLTLKYLSDKKFAQLFLLLPAIGILFFTVLPIVFMVLLAFTNFSSPDHVPPAKLVNWVGFQTFKDLLLLKTWSGTFFGVLKWTIIWAVSATVTTYFGGFLVALLVQQKDIRFKGFWRTILIIPYAIPALISLLMMRNMFNAQFGPINQYLGSLGIYQPQWLTDPTWAKITVVLVNMWIGIPVSMILIMGVLTTISKDLYEAAEVDGASAFQKFRIVTLPLVLFTTAPVLIGQFAGNFNNFNAIFLLTGGGPTVGGYQFAGATDLLVTWLFNLTLSQLKYNIASAIGIIVFFIVASFSIWNFSRSRSFREEDMIQ